MTRARQSVVVLIVLAIAALAVLLTFMADFPLHNRRVLSTLPSPGQGDNALQAQLSTGASRAGAGGSTTEVQVTGRWHGAKVDETVMRSQQAQPEGVRIGWAAPDSLVISIPRGAGDAGKPLGGGDPTYRCGNPSSAIHVVCEAYSTAPQQEQHHEAPRPVPHSPNR